jgi:hypothetical protein
MVPIKLGGFANFAGKGGKQSIQQRCASLCPACLNPEQESLDAGGKPQNFALCDSANFFAGADQDGCPAAPRREGVGQAVEIFVELTCAARSGVRTL